MPTLNMLSLSTASPSTTADRRQLWLTRLSLVVTAVCVAAFLRFSGYALVGAWSAHGVRAALDVLLFTLAILFLVYGNVLYQVCRAAYLRRALAHVPAGEPDLHRLFTPGGPSLTILVPSYKEESRVVWQTLVSAALSQYPAKSVVLLIDDPHRPASLFDASRLQEARNLPLLLQERLRAVAARISATRQEAAAAPADLAASTARLASAFDTAADWLTALADEFLGAAPESCPHGERFFAEQVLRAPARAHAEFAARLRADALVGRLPEHAELDRQWHRVEALFDAQLSTFERKKYANLSREANKAMNLNSYIALMGRSWREVQRGNGWELHEISPELSDFSIPQPDFVITLDADSLVLPEYALRLIHVAVQPGNERLAVIQTPYSSFPGSPVLLERLAGATTDLQYITHQGFTGWNATFWVGANALIRRAALEDIRVSQWENGHEVSVYIQDRTVIEDTESSIDLIAHGWTLYNYPERMAYSATPADFGALLIQRRRWSNGGLLILPKLLRYTARAPKTLALAREFFMRFHYLSSLAGGSLAMLLVFFYPFDDSLTSVWVPLAAAPYFVLYAVDLRRSGYAVTDVLRIYALNLALVPVVIGGVLKSVQQALSGAKIPFGRTPKIAERSATPRLYAAIALLMPLAFLAACIRDVQLARWSHLAFSAVNAAMTTYALLTMQHVRAMLADTFGAGDVADDQPIRTEVPPRPDAVAGTVRGHVRAAERSRR